MTNRNMLIIKNSWSYIVKQPDEAGAMFYDRLFELDPSLKAMFHNDMEHQGKKLIDMMTLMVANLQVMQNIKQEIEALAQRHVHYGTKPEHYITVGKSLIYVLENSLGELWDDETKQTWTDLYTLWSSSMIKAAENLPTQ